MCMTMRIGYGSDQKGGRQVVLVCPVVETSDASDPGSLGIKQQQVTAPCTTPDGSKRESNQATVR